MKTNKLTAIVMFVSIALVSGCGSRQVTPVTPTERVTERVIEVEDGSVADYSARAAHGAIEAGQTVYEAGEDTWDWMKEKKRRAKNWVHKNTEE